MQFPFVVISGLLCALAATPAFSKPVKAGNHLKARQTETSNELEDGPCKEVFFIFARGSTEPGNMASLLMASNRSSRS